MADKITTATLEIDKWGRRTTYRRRLGGLLCLIEEDEIGWWRGYMFLGDTRVQVWTSCSRKCVHEVVRDVNEALQSRWYIKDGWFLTEKEME